MDATRAVQLEHLTRAEAGADSAHTQRAIGTASCNDLYPHTSGEVGRSEPLVPTN